MKTTLKDFAFILPAMIASAILMQACTDDDRPAERTESATQNSTEYRREGFYTLITVRHDGHLWVITGSNSVGSPVHHPDCPCGKEKK